MDWWISEGPDVRTQNLSGGRYHTDRQQQTGSGNKKWEMCILLIAVAKDNVTMLAKLTEEEMGLTEAEICNGKTPTEWRKGQMTFQETLES